MINPSTINPAALPSVALADRRSLPSEPCIYFAIDGQGVVQYIGRSTNPRQRWGGHHCAPALADMPDVRIAYLRLDADLLNDVEAALIEWFAPPLNGQPGRPKGHPDPHYNPDALRRSGWRPPLVAGEFSGLVEAIAQSRGMSKRDIVEAALLAYATAEELKIAAQ